MAASDEASGYTKLSEIRAGKMYNVYGVVGFLKPPLMSITGEHYLTLTLLDQSLPSMEDGLKCVLFYKDQRELPKIGRVGNVVRFHKLKVGEFNGRLQGQRGSGFSWIVADSDQLDKTPDVYHSNTNFTLTDEDNKQIKELKQWFQSSQTRQHAVSTASLKDPLAVRALQESSTSASHPHIAFTPIRDILRCPTVPNKFRCRARVLYYEPNLADEILKLVCNTCQESAQLKELPENVQKQLAIQCPDCLSHYNTEYEFYLLLEDDTGIINVTVCNEDATEFFGDFPFDDVRSNRETKVELETRLSALIAYDLNIFDLSQDISHRPFFECCIKSYKVIWPDDETKNKVCYRVFDTKLY